MTVTVSYELYEFEELSEAAQKVAIDAFRDVNVDYQDWHEGVYEQWKEKLKNLGYGDVTIYYTGFWSQGDGACFITDRVDVKKWITEHKDIDGTLRQGLIELINERDIDWYVKLYHRGHYYHEYCMYIEYEYELMIDEDEENDRYHKYYPMAERLEPVILEDARSLAKELYRALEKEYDYRTADEQVKEWLQDSDNLFYESGKPFVC